MGQTPIFLNPPQYFEPKNAAVYAAFEWGPSKLFLEDVWRQLHVRPPYKICIINHLSHQFYLLYNIRHFLTANPMAISWPSHAISRDILVWIKELFSVLKRFSHVMNSDHIIIHIIISAILDPLQDEGLIMISPIFYVPCIFMLVFGTTLPRWPKTGWKRPHLISSFPHPHCLVCKKITDKCWISLICEILPVEHWCLIELLAGTRSMLGILYYD
ncbi:hypothetical protein GQR58_020856 [Nymphon striatum]|nr:hypothetical protein GQR58_020856 [Nymphon striatum]